MALLPSFYEKLIYIYKRYLHLARDVNSAYFISIIFAKTKELLTASIYKVELTK